MLMMFVSVVCFFKQKTADEMRISDWSSDVCSSDLLCLVQLSDGKGDEHLVRFSPGSKYDAPNLKAVLADPARLKLYHFARFDLAAIEHYLGVTAAPEIGRASGRERVCQYV